MSQPQLVVPRAIVNGLVEAFIASDRSHCSSFDPVGLSAAFAALPGEEAVDYHAASRVLDGFVCYKLSANCNSWTKWMRHRLNQNKRPMP